MNIPIVETDRYKDPCRIASTGSCTIYRAKHEGKNVIVKRFRESMYLTIHDQVVRETTILHNIKHPNIIQLEEIWSEPSYPSLVLEDGGQALWYYAENLTRNERASRFSMVFSQVLTAINYLHINGIIHCDLKATNILINNNIVKLCDFGLARRITGDDLGDLAYTLNYRAPEILAGSSNYNQSADMWAIGCVMYDFITHVMLFGNINNKTDDVLLAIILQEVPATSQELINLNIEHEIPAGIKWSRVDQLYKLLYNNEVNMIKSLLCFTPDLRLSAHECLQLLNVPPENANAEILPLPFIKRKKIKADLNIRYIMVLHILSMQEQFPISPYVVATAVDIYDRFLMLNNEIDQTQLILYYIAAAILASCLHDSDRLYPSDFESIYNETEITNAMKSLFRAVRYNLDSVSLWQIVYEQFKLGILENTEEKIEHYWEKIKEIYLDYEGMIGLNKQQMTQKILKECLK